MSTTTIDKAKYEAEERATPHARRSVGHHAPDQLYRGSDRRLRSRLERDERADVRSRGRRSRGSIRRRRRPVSRSP